MMIRRSTLALFLASTGGAWFGVAVTRRWAGVYGVFGILGMLVVIGALAIDEFSS